MKTNIKSKKFYAEAESMQTGWSKYLKRIDQLKDAVALKKDISLKDAVWILYAEMYALNWEFQDYCIANGWKRKKMPWEAWRGLFLQWYKDTAV